MDICYLWARFFLIVTASVSLIACGGGGGGDSQGPTSFTVSTSAGVNGSISPTSTAVIDGSNTNFTITPDVGYGIQAVSGCSGTLSGSTYTTGTITANCTVIASFIAFPTFTVSTSAGANGSISPTSTAVIDGSTTNFTITPDVGYGIQAVSGCSGTLSGSTYTTGTITANCTVIASFIAFPTFTVSTSAGANGSISPTSTAVIDGSTTNFTITPDVDYGIQAVSGCSGTLSGNTYTTGAITANCTVTASFSVLLSTESAFYSVNGAEWNDYVKNDGATSFTATDAAVDGTETGGYNAVLHGGEMHMVEVTGKSACSGLTAQDELSAFDWVCLDTTNPVRMVSSGLKTDKHLSDLIDFDGAAWETNRVTVNDGGAVYGQSPWSKWWSNPVITDNDGSDGLDMTEGDIRIVTVNPNATYTIAQNKVALVIDPAVTLTGSISMDENIVAASSLSYLWFEGALDITNDNSGVNWNDVTFSVLRNITAMNADASGVLFTGSSNNILSSVTATNNTIGVIASNTSNYNTFSEVTALNNSVGVKISFSSNNTLSQITATNNSYGVDLSNSSNNTLSQITALNNTTNGVWLSNLSTNNNLSQITVSNNTDYGVLLNNDSNGNTLTQVTAANNYYGVTIRSSSNNIMSQVTTPNNVYGLWIQFDISIGTAAMNNTVSQITSTNNNFGIILGKASNNTLSQVTASNNATYGVWVSVLSNNNIFSQLLAANNGRGIYLAASHNNTFSQVTASNNIYGIDIISSSDNTFSGQLQVGNNSIGDCYVNVSTGTNPGLDDDNVAGYDDAIHDGVCLQQGSSDFGTATSGITLANSFVGKVTVNDTTNTSDTNGSASYPADPTTFDWSHYENLFRGWGLDGSSFPSTNHRGQWTTGNGRIWGWSLLNTDTVVLDVLSLPNGNDTLTHTWSDTSTTTFIKNATEILDDGIGNDDGLCETSETCLYNPNIGSYQGHGALVGTGAFADGTLTGITQLRYETNGR